MTIRLLTVLITFNLLLTLAYSSEVHAACNPAPAGAVKYNSSNSYLYVCEGPQWRAIKNSQATGETCTAGQAGRVKFAFDPNKGNGAMQFCDGADWCSVDDGASVSGACTQAGKTRYDSGNENFEYCDGTEWRNVGSPNMGTTCSSYMIMGICNAYYDCYWDGSACQQCGCNRSF